MPQVSKDMEEGAKLKTSLGLMQYALHSKKVQVKLPVTHHTMSMV